MRLRLVACAFLLALLMAAPVRAAPTNAPLAIPAPLLQNQTPVEQQSDYPWDFSNNDCSANVRCVVNPTSCPWDVDDFWGVGSFGYLDAGATISRTVCEVADYNPVLLSLNGMLATWSGTRSRTGLEVIASSPALVITVAYQPQGRTFTVPPTGSGRDWAYRWCANAVYDPGDPSLVAIPGSGRGTNGVDGLGVQTAITLTVTNPTNKRIRGMSLGFARLGTSDQGYGCTGHPYFDPDHFEYPFRWWDG